MKNKMMMKSLACLIIFGAMAALSMPASADPASRDAIVSAVKAALLETYPQPDHIYLRCAGITPAEQPCPRKYGPSYRGADCGWPAFQNQHVDASGLRCAGIGVGTGTGGLDSSWPALSAAVLARHGLKVLCAGQQCHIVYGQGLLVDGRDGKDGSKIQDAVDAINLAENNAFIQACEWTGDASYSDCYSNVGDAGVRAASLEGQCEKQGYDEARCEGLSNLNGNTQCANTVSQTCADQCANLYGVYQQEYSCIDRSILDGTSAAACQQASRCR